MFFVASGRSFRVYFLLHRLLVLPVRENRQVFQRTTKEGKRYQDNILGGMAEWLKAPVSGYATGQMRQELIAQPAGSNPATSATF